MFVRSPDDATEVAKLISDNAKPKKSKDNPDPKGRFTGAVEVLTGTMRGVERDEFIRKPNVQRFLDGDVKRADPVNQEPVFLVSTSAGEVGFDLNADHMVCDASPLDSMIQRLGRVNRRGDGEAKVTLVLPNDAAKKTAFDKASSAAADLFDDGMDVSPRSIDEMKSRDKVQNASTPIPTMLEVTDVLLDAWSMTTITDRMPGRPHVAPWLRGVEEDLAQRRLRGVWSWNC